MILEKRPLIAANEFIQEFNKSVRSINTEKEFNKTKELVKYYREHKASMHPLQPLEDRWFDSLKNNGEPDYGIYEDKDYYIEVWACWANYSRMYLKRINAKKDELFNNVNCIVDLGNGLGNSTAALTEMYPNAVVHGTNFPGCEQWKYCETLQKKYNFNLIEDSSEIKNVDLIFASEYFEHFFEPIAHLDEIIKNNNPRYMIVANSFGTIGIGHFKEYLVNGVLIDWKKIGRMFNKHLKDLGYTKVKTGFYNASPAVYERIA